MLNHSGTFLYVDGSGQVNENKLHNKPDAESTLLDENYSHESNARADVDDCTIVFVTLDGNVVAYDGWKGSHIWSLETGGQLLSSSVPTENLQGYGPNINTGVSHSSSMIVPAVDGSIFSIHTNEHSDINEGSRYVVNSNANHDATGSLMSSYSSPKLKLHRLPVSAQDIVLQPFLVQSGEEVDIKGDVIDNPEADPALLHGDKASKVFVLDLRSGKIKDGTQDSENVPGSATYNYQDEIDSVDLDDNDACYGDDDTDADASTNGNEQENDPFVQRCKGERFDGNFAQKESSSRTLLLTRTDFLVRAINTRRGSEMWNASVGRIDIVSPRMKRNSQSMHTFEHSAPRVSYNHVGQVQGFDRKTGKLLWNSRLNQQPASMHIFMGSRLVEEIFSFSDTSAAFTTNNDNAFSPGERTATSWFLGSLDGGWNSVFAIPSKTELDKLPTNAQPDGSADKSSSTNAFHPGKDIVKMEEYTSFRSYHRVEVEDEATGLIPHAPQVVAQRPVNIVPIELSNNFGAFDSFHSTKTKQQALPNTDYFSRITPPSQDHSHSKDTISLFHKWRRRKEMKKAIEEAANVLSGEDGAVHSYVFQGGLVLSWRGLLSFFLIIITTIVAIIIFVMRYYRQWYQGKLEDIRNTPPPTPTAFPSGDSIPVSPLSAIPESDTVINELKLSKSTASYSDDLQPGSLVQSSKTEYLSKSGLISSGKETNSIGVSDKGILKNSSDNSITEENKNLVTKAGSALAVTTDIGSNSSFSFASDVYQKREANVEMKRSISADSALSDEMAAMVCENRYSNDYEEYKQLGRGGFGAVYACKNRLDGRKYAIKKIRLSSAKHMEKQLHKVLREVKILARLDHKNIVRYFQAWIESVDPESSYQIVYGSPKNEDSFAEEFSETTGATSYDTSANASSPTKSLPTEYDLILYIQMQYCSQTLKEYINDPNRKVDLAEILGITQQIALGTQHIHQSGLIHRDLKPENVFFHEKEVKLGDFGLSRAVESDEADGFFSEEFDGHSMPVLDSTNHSSEKSDSTVLDARNQKVARDVRRRKSTLRLGGGGFYKSLSPGSRSRSHSLSIKYSATGIGGKGELTSQIGTFTYASPEQIDGGEYNSSTDMFSLGVILFEMCHLPFSTGMERMVTISNAREGVYGTYWESLSKSNPGIATLLNQLLSTTPSKRPTAANVVETCEMLKSQILNTAADSKQNELEAENKRLKALVARYSGDYNDDGSDIYQSVAESGPRVISRNTPVNILPPAAGNTTSLDMSESSVDNETRKVLARMNTM